MKQVEGLRNSPRQTAPWIYDEIEEYVMDSPDATFQEIVTYVSRQHGIAYNEFLKKYKRAEKVYLKSPRVFSGVKKSKRKHF